MQSKFHENENEWGQNSHGQGERVKIPLYQTMQAKRVPTTRDHNKIPSVKRSKNITNQKYSFIRGNNANVKQNVANSIFLTDIIIIAQERRVWVGGLKPVGRKSGNRNAKIFRQKAENRKVENNKAKKLQPYFFYFIIFPFFRVSSAIF